MIENERALAKETDNVRAVCITLVYFAKRLIERYAIITLARGRYSFEELRHQHAKSIVGKLPVLHSTKLGKCRFAGCRAHIGHPRNLSSRHSAIAQTFVTMGDGHESRGFAGAPDG